MSTDNLNDSHPSLERLFACCESEVKILQRSPCFAMSRGGKELFHTNFLSFVLEIDPANVAAEERTVISEVQAALIGVLFRAGGEAVTPPASVQTWREQNSLDLVVLAAPTVEMRVPSFAGCGPMEWGGSRSKAPGHDLGVVGVVIEAKFKALPTRDQLTRYDARLHRELRLDLAESLDVDDECAWGSIGLTLDGAAPSSDASGKAKFVARELPSDPSTPDGNPSRGAGGSPIFAKASGRVVRVLLSPTPPDWLNETPWKHLAWRTLIEAMERAIPTSAPRTGLVELLCDYVQFTDQLLQVIAKASRAVDAYCQHGSMTRFNKLAAVHKPFAKLRVHDVVGKVAFDQLRYWLAKSVAEKRAADPRLDSFAFLSRGMPGLVLQFSWHGDKDMGLTVGIGVQIQGTKYRHFLTASKVPEGQTPQLLDLAKKLGSPLGESKEERGWWHIDAAAQLPEFEMTLGNRGNSNRRGRNQPPSAAAGFLRFGEQEFVYTQIDIEDFDFAQLLSLVESSMDHAARVLEPGTVFLRNASALVAANMPAN